MPIWSKGGSLLHAALQLKRLNLINCTVYLMCVNQENIKFPPIPGFPVSVGSIEYQLISLAADAFDSSLLNSEGVAR